jgi:hypothetical protein
VGPPFLGGESAFKPDLDFSVARLPTYRVAFYERRLLHSHPEGRDIFIRWRLYGTLPPNRFVPPDGLTSGQAFAWIDRYLDSAADSPSWLRTPGMAQGIANALQHAQMNCVATPCMRT